MNGSDFSYTNVTDFDLVNMSNSEYEWAWNESLQRIKMDMPKIGGVYDVYVFANNRSVGSSTRLIVNPYDVCMATRNSPSGGYYVWQFQTSDSIYFEMKIAQANNPIGKASALNFSTNASSTVYGGSSFCYIGSEKQNVTNATVTILEIRNTQSGELQDFDSVNSSCQLNNNSYICTIKPTSRWAGGMSVVKFSIQGEDGTIGIAHGMFEARAFYLYGYTTSYQNNPSSDISLNLRMYTAGNNWWSGSTGVNGTVSLKKVEYQGSNGEWIWPPVSYDFNVSNVSNANINAGQGSITLRASDAPDGSWKTGNYRVIIQGNTSTGETDYGYAWFSVRLWDTYGQPVECTSSNCDYKNYFNLRENVTLYVKISKAGEYDYYNQGGRDIGGNVSVSVKKIMNCKTWPCQEINSSQYSANVLNVNTSSPWYSSANSTYYDGYILKINSTSGLWSAGSYSVILDVNGSDTGSAWFNTIAFYSYLQPVISNGSTYKYDILRNSPAYFNLSTTRNYKNQYYNSTSGLYQSPYVSEDYVNTSVVSLILRTWDSQTQTNKEYSYPSDLGISPLTINGTGILNVTFSGGVWPAGYYWGELTLKNALNETSSTWAYINVQPFRVGINQQYNIDEDQCASANLSIFDPDYNNQSFVYGNYSITNISENVYIEGVSYFSNYTNFSYTNSSGLFNSTTNLTLCPNSGNWGVNNNWGGYHSVNLLVLDNATNDSKSVWMSFRALPFAVTWTSPGYYQLTSSDITTNLRVAKVSNSSVNASGNLTGVYQWIYDGYSSVKTYYNFSVGECSSSVSGQCGINGTQAITIYHPTSGWKNGYNYLYGEWTKQDSTTKIEDWGGIYFYAY